MNYLKRSFSVHPGSEKAYRDNYDAVFGKKRPKKSPPPPVPAPGDLVDALQDRIHPTSGRLLAQKQVKRP